jgi:hypothetical protein
VTDARTAQPRADEERHLRVLLRSKPGLNVLTGGQTGVDTYAAVAALRAGLRVHVVFPAGYRQEDGPLTAARRRQLSRAQLHELSWPSFRYRTWTCVYVADVVVLLDPARRRWLPGDGAGRAGARTAPAAPGARRADGRPGQ